MPAIRSRVEHRHPKEPTRREHVTEMAAVFALLGDQTRLALLLELLGANELCVSELSARVGVADTAVSHALRLLRAHQVVGARREGNWIYYSLIDEHVRLLLQATDVHLHETH